MAGAYGDSYGGVQSAALAESAATRSGLETALSRFLGMLHQRQELANTDREFNARTANAAQNLELSQRQLDMQKERFAEEAQRASESLAFAKQKHAEDLAFSMKALDAETKRASPERGREFDFNSHLGLAQIGRAPAKDKLRTFGFNDSQIEVLDRTNQAARQLQKQQFDFADSVARAQKESQDILGQIEEFSKKNRGVFGGPGSYGGGKYQKQIDELSKRKAILDEYIKKAETRKDFSQLVAPDPSSGMYRPLVPPPYEENVQGEPSPNPGTIPGLPNDSTGESSMGAPAGAARSFGFGGPFTGGNFTTEQTAAPVVSSPASTRVLRYNVNTGQLE